MGSCELCTVRPATRVCSGLDRPELRFCTECAHRHEATCPDIKSGASQMWTMGGFEEVPPKPILDEKQFSFELSALATRHASVARERLVRHDERLRERLKDAERRLASIVKLSTPVGEDWKQHAYLTLEMVNDIAKQNNHEHEWEIYNDQPRVYGCACGAHASGTKMDEADARVVEKFSAMGTTADAAPREHRHWCKLDKNHPGGCF